MSVPVIVYHQITVTKSKDTLCDEGIPATRFESQMRYLYEHEFETTTPDVIAESMKGLCQVNKKRVVITFDDGYLDNYEYAFPVLQKYRYSATIFLVSDCVGGKRNWGHSSPVPLMDWCHIREMSRYGICFQSHTCTHPDLTTLNHERVSGELSNSRKKIEDALGLSVRHLAYPFGAHNPKVMHLVEDAGYSSAFTFGRQGGSRFCRERFTIHSRDGSLRFALKTSSLGIWARKILQGSHLNLDRKTGNTIF